jgi:hypothetical protein
MFALFVSIIGMAAMAKHTEDFPSFHQHCQFGQELIYLSGCR